MINFVELKRTYDLYACEYEEAVLKAMRSGWYIMGKELSEFERQFASYVGSKYCIWDKFRFGCVDFGCTCFRH